MAAINKNCVPVAIPGGNSLTVRTATGEVLGAPQPGWNSEFGPAMAEFSALPSDEKRPTELKRTRDEAVRGKVPDGMLVSRVFVRNLQREGLNQLTRTKYHSEKYHGPQRDFLWITADEQKSLIPDLAKLGDSFAVPDAIAHRIFKFYLVDSTVGFCNLWDDEHLRRGSLTATVTRADESGVQLHVAGEAVLSDLAELSESPRKAQFQFLGVIEADAGRRINRFEMIALGDWFNSNRREYYAKRGLNESAVLGLYFELAKPGSLGFGVPPALIRRGDDESYARYFGKNKTQLGLKYDTATVAKQTAPGLLESPLKGLLVDNNKPSNPSAPECKECSLEPARSAEKSIPPLPRFPTVRSAPGSESTRDVTPSGDSQNTQLPAQQVARTSLGTGEIAEESTGHWLIMMCVAGIALVVGSLYYYVNRPQPTPYDVFRQSVVSGTPDPLER